MSHPHYKLTYFDVRGLAEPIRMLFAYVKVPYEDNRFQREQWPAIKPTTPFHQAPMFEVDGKQYGQSGAILRMLAKKYKLAGTTDEEQVHVDAIYDYGKGTFSAKTIEIILKKFNNEK